jgi:hypothetical protein
MGTLTGTTVHHPIREDVDWSWAWLRTEEGTVQLLIRPVLVEAVDLQPRMRIKVEGHWRERQAPKFRQEDQDTFFVVHALEVLEGPDPPPFSV